MAIRIYGLRPYEGKLSHRRLNVTATSVITLFANAQTIINKISEIHQKEGLYNLFWTAGHTDIHRKVEYQDIVPLDIDDITFLPTTPIERYVEVISRVTCTDHSKCGIILSGNGLQYIIHVDKTFSPQYFKIARKFYRSLCKKIDYALLQAELPGTCDPSIWSDARLLRLPFTENRKPMLPKEGEKVVIKKATLYNANVEPQEFDLKNFEFVNSISRGEICHNKTSAETLLSECGFMAKQYVCKGEGIAEPEWFAALGVAAWLEDYGKLAHEISEGHASYDPEETEAKIDHCRESDGPRTCESLAEFYDCENCKYWGRVTTPLNIKLDRSNEVNESCGIGNGGPSETFCTEKDEKKSHTTIKNTQQSPNIPLDKPNNPIDKKSEGGYRFSKPEFDAKGNIKKIVRDYNGLREYFDKIYSYQRLGDLKRTIVFRDGKFEKVSGDWLRGFANKEFKPTITKDTDREEFVKNVTSNKVVDSFWLSDKKEGFINCANGILNIGTGELIEHNPAYKFFYKLPYDYNKEASCDVWDELLRNLTLNRRILIESIEEFLGYCLYGGEYLHQKVLIFCGEGENGKSTLLRAFEMVLGSENVSKVAITKLDTSFAAASLENKLANYSEDEGPSCFKNTGMIKKLTGNTPIYVEHKFEQGYNLLNTAKIIMSYNEMPFLEDLSKGMRRRLMIIPFDLDLRAQRDKCIKDIYAKLESERSGILNRAIEGWHRLKTRGEFQEIEESMAILQEMMCESDKIYDWACSNIVDTKDDKDRISTKELFTAYSKDYGIYNENVHSFGKRLSKWMKVKGFKNRHTLYKESGVPKKGFLGLKLIQKIDEKDSKEYAAI